MTYSHKAMIAAVMAVTLAAPLAVGAQQMADARGGFEHGEHFGGGRQDRMGYGRGSGPLGGGRAMEMMQEFDANGDGALTQDEIDTARAARLGEFDADGDGSLNLEEYQALWLDAMHGAMVDRFQSHDDDGDGKVTAEEFGEPWTGMVARMDVNGDGKLDRSDMEAMHDFGPRGGRGPEGGPGQGMERGSRGGPKSE